MNEPRDKRELSHRMGDSHQNFAKLRATGLEVRRQQNQKIQRNNSSSGRSNFRSTQNSSQNPTQKKVEASQMDQSEHINKLQSEISAKNQTIAQQRDAIDSMKASRQPSVGSPSEMSELLKELNVHMTESEIAAKRMLHETLIGKTPKERLKDAAWVAGPVAVGVMVGLVGAGLLAEVLGVGPVNPT